MEEPEKAILQVCATTFWPSVSAYQKNIVIRILIATTMWCKAKYISLFIYSPPKYYEIYVYVYHQQLRKTIRFHTISDYLCVQVVLLHAIHKICW